MTARIDTTSVRLLTNESHSSAAGRSPQPSPLVLAPEATSDPREALAWLERLISERRRDDSCGAAQRLDEVRHVQIAKHTEKLAALGEQRQKESDAEKWGVVSKVASAVAVAASAVLSVCTCGAATGLCVAACALSAASFAEGETHALGRLTGDERNSTYIAASLGVAGALCSGGSTLASTTATTLARAGAVVATSARVAAPIVAATTHGTGGAVAGAALAVAGALGGGMQAFGASSAAANGSTLARGSALAASTVDASATTARGVATAACSLDEHDAAMADARARAATSAGRRLDQAVNAVLDAARELDESHARALASLSESASIRSETWVVASGRRA